jgi:hypothetical protein
MAPQQTTTHASLFFKAETSFGFFLLMLLFAKVSMNGRKQGIRYRPWNPYE